MKQLTAPRIDALFRVFDLKVSVLWSPEEQGRTYMVAGFWQKPRQSVYQWLQKEGYLLTPAPSMRSVGVRLSQKGFEAVKALCANDKAPAWWSEDKAAAK